MINSASGFYATKKLPEELFWIDSITVLLPVLEQASVYL
jgi:hypothetical protein